MGTKAVQTALVSEMFVVVWQAAMIDTTAGTHSHIHQRQRLRVVPRHHFGFTGIHQPSLLDHAGNGVREAEQ